MALMGLKTLHQFWIMLGLRYVESHGWNKPITVTDILQIILFLQKKTHSLLMSSENEWRRVMIWGPDTVPI